MSSLPLRCVLGGLATCVIVVAGCSRDPEYAKSEYMRSGDRYFAEKKYSEAILQYRNALRYDEKFGPARYKLAESYERAGDAGAAGREFIRSADAMPGDASVQLRAGAYLLRMHQFEEARARAQRALRLEPRNADALIMLGNSLAGLRNFDEALKQLDEATKINPSSATAYNSIASVQVTRGNRQDAEIAYRKAVDANPKSVPALHALANFLWATARRAEAEDVLKRALALEPKNALTRMALATFYIAVGRAAEAEPHLKTLADGDTSASGGQRLALADYYIVMNRTDDAMAQLEAMARKGGRNDAARTRVAAIEYSRKNAGAAHKEVDQLLAANPKNLAALLMKASFLGAEGKYDEAIRRAKVAAEVEPKSIQAHYVLGTLYRRKGAPENAIAEFNEVIKLNPRAAAAQVELSQLTLARREPHSALQFAQDAATALPRDSGVQLNLAKVMVANNELDHAERVMKPLRQQFPGSAQVQLVSGSIAYLKGDLAGARRELSRAIELAPTDVEALAALVLVDLAEKKPSDARARVEQRLAATPDRPALLLLAGRVYMHTGDWNAADQVLQKAIEKDPSNLQGYDLLSQLYARTNRLADAKVALGKIVAARPDAVGTSTMIAVVSALQGDRAAARKEYEGVLQTDPGAAVAANNLAYMYASDGGNLDIALQLAQTAKEKLPDAPEVDDTLGWVYFKKDLATLAVPPLERAALKDPKNATYRYHLGLAYARAGNQAKARETLDVALRLDPKSSDAEAARQIMAGKEPTS